MQAFTVRVLPFAREKKVLDAYFTRNPSRRYQGTGSEAPRPRVCWVLQDLIVIARARTDQCPYSPDYGDCHGFSFI